MAAFCGTFGGAFLGIGLSSVAQGPSDPVVMKVLAQSCASDGSACEKLALAGSPPIVWTVIGVVFLGVFLISVVASAYRTKAAAATSRTVSGGSSEPPGM